MWKDVNKLGGVDVIDTFTDYLYTIYPIVRKFLFGLRTKHVIMYISPYLFTWLTDEIHNLVYMNRNFIERLRIIIKTYGYSP